MVACTKLVSEDRMHLRMRASNDFSTVTINAEGFARMCLIIYRDADLLGRQDITNDLHTFF